MADDVEVVEMELVANVTAQGVALTPGSERSIPFVVDKPPRLGGTDRGMMPSEYFGAAIASCNLMTARRIAEKRKVPYSRLRCRVDIHFAGSDIAKVVLNYTVGTTATAEEWDTVFRLADRTCTVSRATACPIERTVTVE